MSSLSENKETVKNEADAAAFYNENNLVNVNIENENIALNVMVSYLNVAQRRGVFNMAESAKIWECIQKFQKSNV
jgi:hypothetical protein